MMPGAQTPSGGSGNTNDVFGEVADGMGDFNPPGYNEFPKGQAQVSYAQGATSPVTGSFKAGKVGMKPLD